MRPYATVSPLFWTGTTGKRLRANPDAQRLAFYLMTSPHSHQSGVYYLPMMYLCHEVGIDQEGATKALAWLSQEAFCTYDQQSEWVWVHEMAAWQIGTELSEQDKRCKGIQQYIGALPELTFLGAFVDRYAGDYYLSGRGLKGASSDQNRSGTGTDQEQKGRADAPDDVNSGSAAESKPRGHSRARQLPDDFALDEELSTYATTRLPGVQVPQLLENFRNHHKSRGEALKDWRAAWRTWVGKAISYGYPGQQRGRANPEPPRSRAFPS